MNSIIFFQKKLIIYYKNYLLLKPSIDVGYYILRAHCEFFKRLFITLTCINYPLWLLASVCTLNSKCIKNAMFEYYWLRYESKLERTYNFLIARLVSCNLRLHFSNFHDSRTSAISIFAHKWKSARRDEI